MKVNKMIIINYFIKQTMFLFKFNITNKIKSSSSATLPIQTV